MAGLARIHLLDILRRMTGRRSLLRQPGFAQGVEIMGEIRLAPVVQHRQAMLADGEAGRKLGAGVVFSMVHESVKNVCSNIGMSPSPAR